MKRILAAAALVLAVVSPAAAATVEKSSSAIVRLLNSRSSGSVKEYVEAAAVVAEDAKAGRPLQKFLIALVAGDADLPADLRLTDAQRRDYLAQSRDRIRRLAEEKGNALAWYLLSLENDDLGFLKRAADGDNVQALNAWGTLCMNKIFADQDADTNEVDKVLLKSFGCFKKAADKGDANGLYNLGMCYLRGYGCAVDEDLALKCFRAGAEAGHPEAINNLGGFFRDGVVVQKNLETAARWFARSAELGNALALARGEGVDKDEEKAVALLKKASERGNAEAMDAYGMSYLEGRGVPKDEAEAVKWFRASAARGFAPAMDNLSVCYERGLGVKQNSKEGTVWKVRAMAARGDRNAAAWLMQNGR